MLRGSFGAAMALPWLEAMAPAAPLITTATSTIARKAAAGQPVRMAFLYVPNGMNMPGLDSAWQVGNEFRSAIDFGASS